MAKQPGKSTKPPTAGTNPPANGTAALPERLPAYFLSLTLENVRCFGPKQTLDLSDGHGKPAPWTIILGLNGTGKTTLLQALVLEYMPGQLPKRGTDVVPMLAFVNGDLLLIRSPEVKPAIIRVRYAVSKGLSAATAVTFETTITLQAKQVSARLASELTAGDTKFYWPLCCAYGAGRRVGSAAISDADPNDSLATLFVDRAELRNPEKWLLELDYAAKANAGDQEAQRRSALARE